MRSFFILTTWPSHRFRRCLSRITFSEVVCPVVPLVTDRQTDEHRRRLKPCFHCVWRVKVRSTRWCCVSFSSACDVAHRQHVTYSTAWHLHHVNRVVINDTCQQQQHTHITHRYRLRKHGHSLWNGADISFLAEVITTSGFGRDRYTILVIRRRHIPYVVSFFVEFPPPLQSLRGPSDRIAPVIMSPLCSGNCGGRLLNVL